MVGGTMRKYYRKDGLERVLLSEISNGFILTEFTDTGMPYGNDGMQFFVTSEELATWEKFDFKLPPNEARQRKGSALIRSIVGHLYNYGISNHDVENFREWESTVATNVYADIVRCGSIKEVENYIDMHIDRGDSDFDSEACKQVAYILFEIFKSMPDEV